MLPTAEAPGKPGTEWVMKGPPVEAGNAPWSLDRGGEEEARLFPVIKVSVLCVGTQEGQQAFTIKWCAPQKHTGLARG